MRSWRFYAFGDMRLDEIPVPELKPRHVLVEPLCVQPSVTEAQLALGIRTLAYERVKKRLETEAPIALFGHEFCARIVEVGEGVTRFRAGDRVAARAKLPCETCALCQSERSHQCRRGPVIGFDLPGCFSELALLPEISLVKVDDMISDSEAACLQSLSDSVAAVETAQIQMGDTVLIIGQGSMGLEILQIARISGAGRIITIDVRDESCQLSRQLGADFAFNARQSNVAEEVADLTEGLGADVVFECAGGSPNQGMAGTATVEQAIRLARSGGKVIGVSWFGSPFEVDVDLMRERSLRYLFPDVSTQSHLVHTVRLVASGRVRLRETITHQLTGIESVPRAFEITAHKGKHQAINPAQVMMRG